MSTEPVIRIDSLTKRFDSTTALSDVDLTVGRGEIVVLLGLSGSGKSTLLRHIDALEIPTSGSVSVLGEQVPALRGKALRRLRSRVGCSEHAADLAQDTFVRLLRARQLSPLKEPRAYLSSIARGLMIDQFRRRALERAYQESLAHLPEAEVPSEEDRLVILDTLARLDRALHQLKPRARQAFLLAQLDGLSIVQIALRLGVSRATVERDLAKALGVCYRLRYADA